MLPVCVFEFLQLYSSNEGCEIFLDGLYDENEKSIGNIGCQRAVIVAPE